MAKFVAAAVTASWLLIVRVAHAKSARARRKQATQNDLAVYLNTVREFPYLHQMSINLSMLRGFSIPRAAAVVVRTTYNVPKPQAKENYDSTQLLVAEALFHPTDDMRHKLACARINQIHGHYASQISQDLMIFGVGCAILEYTRLVNTYGARKLTPRELQAIVAVNVDFGLSLGLNGPDMPSTHEGWEEWMHEFETLNQGYSRAGEECTQFNMRNIVLDGGKPTGWFRKQFVLSVVDEALKRAVGLPMGSPPGVKFARCMMFIRKLSMRVLLPPRRKWDGRIQFGPCPAKGQRLHCKFYEAWSKKGYTFESLGPPMYKELEREELLKNWSTCPYAPNPVAGSSPMPRYTRRAEP